MELTGCYGTFTKQVPPPREFPRALTKSTTTMAIFPLKSAETELTIESEVIFTVCPVAGIVLALIVLA